MSSEPEETANVMRLGIVLLLATWLHSPACSAAEVVWGFGGVVTWANQDKPPPSLDVGDQFAGTIHFNTNPAGSTLASNTMQHFAWQGAGSGVRLRVAGLDFSVSDRADAFLELSKGNDNFSLPHRTTDSLLIVGGSEMYSPEPPVAGEIHVDFLGYRRNVFIEFHDLDRSAFSDVSLPLIPFDINDFEVRRVIANYSIAGDSDGYVFYGDIDQVFLIPEPSALLLFVVGGSLSFCIRARRTVSRSACHRY